VEIKTEADSDDMSECPHDEQPSTCTFSSDFTIQAFYDLFYYLTICAHLPQSVIIIALFDVFYVIANCLRHTEDELHF